MSILSSLVLSLLCFSLNVGAARLLGFLADEPDHRRILLPVQKDEEVQLGKVAAPTSMADANMSNGDSVSDRMEKDRDNEKKLLNDQELKGARAHKAESGHYKISGETSTSIKSKFEAVRVSWHVPRKKQGVPRPGFNLDYEPPKVHPPVHN